MRHPRGWPKVPYLTGIEAAKLKGVDPMSIYRAIERGALAGYKSGTIWLVNVQSLAAWEMIGHNPPKTHPRPRRSAQLKKEARDDE